MLKRFPFPSKYLFFTETDRCSHLFKILNKLYLTICHLQFSRYVFAHDPPRPANSKARRPHLLRLRVCQRLYGGKYSDLIIPNTSIKGVCKIYEEHLKRLNPSSPQITYDISQVHMFFTLNPSTRVGPQTADLNLKRLLFSTGMTDSQIFCKYNCEFVEHQSSKF